MAHGHRAPLVRALRRGLGAALAALALLTIFSAAARADTLRVCAGCQYTDISDALAAASAGDRVRVSPGTYTEQLSISKDVTLLGAGSRSTTIQAPLTGQARRVVEVAAGARVTIFGVTIRRGYIAGPGAGIFNSGDLVLRRVAVAANQGDFGAGILNAGTMRIADSGIRGNDANFAGGGISNGGSLTIVRSTLSGNDGGQNGGAISNTGQLRIDSSTLSGNVAATGAGLVNDGTVEITRSRLRRNTAGVTGGAIDNGGTVTITGSSLSGNEADRGGAIFNAGRVSLQGSAISGNVAHSQGGGIFGTEDATLNLLDTLVRGNQPDDCTGPGC